MFNGGGNSWNSFAMFEKIIVESICDFKRTGNCFIIIVYGNCYSKLRRGAELKKVLIKQQKSLFHYQQKISKCALSTFDHHQKNLYEWILEYKVKKCLNQKKSWILLKTVAKFHYFHFKNCTFNHYHQIIQICLLYFIWDF